MGRCRVALIAVAAICVAACSSSSDIGAPPNGISPIDEPIGAVDWLDPDEAVFVAELDGTARVYPVQIMIWHEIVNDVIGDRPVSVTYCPLCNSGVAFDRRVGDDVLDFGTSGALHQANLVMYDRQMHVDTFWIAWATFHLDTQLVDPS